MVPTDLIIAGERVTVRDAAPDEISLILDTWIKSAERHRITRRSVFKKFYPGVVYGLTETESAVVLTKEGGNTVHAWACGRPPNLLHYAYVPHALRGNGLGRAVITGVLQGYPKTIYVTATPLSAEYTSRFSSDHHNDANGPRFLFNPYVMRTG